MERGSRIVGVGMRPEWREKGVLPNFVLPSLFQDIANHCFSMFSILGWQFLNVSR